MSAAAVRTPLKKSDTSAGDWLVSDARACGACSMMSDARAWVRDAELRLACLAFLPRTTRQANLQIAVFLHQARGIKDMPQSPRCRSLPS